ncbi:MAG: DUF3035 domain-containing protein [Rhodobacteraceae bacterium]|nr:DUF3035 domain-containing protein [Paracoccaceae bacterium]
MTIRTNIFALLAIAAVAITACGPRNPDLLTFRRSGEGPDEFTVAPSKPLADPPAAGALPPPTLGVGINRADATPEADAIVALGGRQNATTLDGIPTSDAALIRHAGRNGQSTGIRQTLAQEDIEFRRRNDGLILERLANSNLYFDAYEQQSLNQQREIDRLRQRGIQTPGAPPAELFPE